MHHSSFAPRLGPYGTVAAGAPDRFTSPVQVGTVAEGLMAGPSTRRTSRRACARCGTGTWAPQLLVGLSGTCVVGIEEQPLRRLAPGEAVRIEPEVRHWHGAGPEEAASHLR